MPNLRMIYLSHTDVLQLVYCLTSGLPSHFSVISWREQVNFQWDDDAVRFVPDQHAEWDLYSASSLKQQSAVDMSLHSDTLFWFRANQSLHFLLNDACLAEKQQIPISLKIYLFSPWYNWKMAELALSNNHSLTLPNNTMRSINNW
jgi:hypothetical protein